MPAKQITRADILNMAAFEAVREDKRRDVVAAKRHRRIAVGPDATFYFESYQTMWWQIHEMLFIEKGGEEQIPDELAAYNPLIPQGRELVATLMFEIDDEARRKRVLSALGGVEETCVMTVAGATVMGQSEEDIDRTTADGKASSVQFIHFTLSEAQAAAFKKSGTEIAVGIKHPTYGHMAILSEDARAALAEDLD